MSTDLPAGAYPTPENATSFYETVVERLRSVPGVEQASVSLNLPLDGVEWGEFINVPGAKESLLVRVKMVDPWYFATHLPLRRLRCLLAIPHRTGAAPPLPRLDRRSKVAAPSAFTCVH